MVDAPKEIGIRVLELIRYVQAAYSFSNAFWPVTCGQWATRVKAGDSDTDLAENTSTYEPVNPANSFPCGMWL